MKANRTVRNPFSQLGGPLFDRYIEGRVQEWDEYRMYVSQWELDRYLPVY